MEDYLEKKRELFNRFFFLSNYELLDLISKSKSLDMITPYLKKMFDNIFDLEIEDSIYCKAIISCEGEKLYLKSLIFKS